MQYIKLCGSSCKNIYYQTVYPSSAYHRERVKRFFYFMPMKESSYFPHYSTSKDEPNCVLLIDQLGLEGYGIYWVLIETLRAQENFRYPLKLIPSLARRYGTSQEKMKAVITNFELFQVEDSEFFCSEDLNKAMSEIATKKLKYSKAGQQGMLNRWKSNHKETENDNDVITMLSDKNNDVITTDNNKSKEKEIKVNESKEKEIKVKEKKPEFDFSIFTEPEKEVIQTWVEFRKQIKKPLTQFAINLLKKDIEKTSLQYLKAQIENSIKNGWQGLFELKQPLNQKSNSNFIPANLPDKTDPNRMLFKHQQIKQQANGIN